MDVFAKWPLVSINSVLCLTATVTNLLVILIILRTPRLHTPSNVLLCSLALSDIGVGLVVQPMFVVILAEVHRLEQFMEFASMFLIGVSFLTLTAIAVDRYLALVLHLRYKAVVTVRRVSLAISFLWSLILLANILRYILDFKTRNIVMVSVICVCLITSTYCYFQIHRIVRQHQRQIKDQSRSLPSASAPVVKQGKVVKTMYYIHGLFVICVLPYPISLGMFISLGSRPDTVVFICSALTILFANSSLNPYLFCWRMRDIRQALKQLLKRHLNND